MKKAALLTVACALLALLCLSPATAYAGGAPGTAAPASWHAPAQSDAVPNGIIMSPAGTPAKITRKSCIFIGDSLTGRGTLTKYIMEYAAADSVKLRLTGTRGTGSNRHEGRPGWRMIDYISRQSSRGMTNAFYNPSTRKFDFTYYMRTNGFITPGYVFIEMGINDTFLYNSDSSLNAEIKNILTRYEAMIASIRAYNSGIKIGILVTIPPTSIESTFKADYSTRQTLNRYRRNNTLWVTAMKARFKVREGHNIFLVPTDAGIDRAHIVGVHPDDTGFRQIAAVVWAWMIGH